MAKNVGQSNVDGSNLPSSHRNMNCLSPLVHLSALATSIEWYHLDRRQFSIKGRTLNLEPETSTLKPLWFLVLLVSFLCYFFFFLFLSKQEREKLHLLSTFLTDCLPPIILKLCPATLSLINHSNHFTFSGILSADFLLPFPLPQKCF